MVEILSEFYAAGAAVLAWHFSLAHPRALSEAPRGRIRSLDQWLTALLKEAGMDGSMARERAEDAIMQIQGALILSNGLMIPSRSGESCGGFPSRCSAAKVLARYGAVCRRERFRSLV
jgi:hypothetical protein